MAVFLNVRKLCCILVCILSFIIGLNGDRITEKIYQKIEGGFSCFRRLNGTHQIGCSSSQRGNVGIVHYATNEEELKWLIDVGPDAPYVVLLRPDMFRRNHLMKLTDSGKIAGVLVLNGTTPSNPTAPYSNDLTCPNTLSGLYTEQYSSYCQSNPWNPAGDGLLFEDIPFPIFFINETNFNQSTLLDDCFYKFNQPVDGVAPAYPLCAVELKAFMWAAVDSPTCIRRGQLNDILNPQPSEFCDPLGNVNIFVPLLVANKSDGALRNRSLIFISARMDSASMFDGLSVGADTAITSLVTLVAITEMLSKVKDQLRNRDVDNVILVLFNGETFDYIGSSRMAYDMMNGNFPRPLKEENPSQGPLIRLEHIKYWIELGSLAPHSNATVYLHSDPISTSDASTASKVNELNDKITRNKGGLTVEVVNSSAPLPPASLQSFLKKDIGIPGVVISNHRTAFTNQFYNNEWDNFDSINSNKLSKHLGDIARTVAAAVYQLSTGEFMPATVNPNMTLLEDTLECYLVNANCSLFNWLLNGKSNLFSEGVLPTYVGVPHGDDSFKPLPMRTRHLLTLVSGEELQINKSTCYGSVNDEIYHYYWLGESESNTTSGLCYKSTVKTSVAVSPAFIVDGYNWTSGEYSSWTESRWENLSIRIFVKASTAQEVTVFVFGLFVLIVSFAITYWMDVKSNVLFPQCTSGDGVAC